jgi:hypothetical protein
MQYIRQDLLKHMNIFIIDNEYHIDITNIYNLIIINITHLFMNFLYCDIFAQGKNCEANRVSRY